jgi:hypothetical protein
MEENNTQNQLPQTPDIPEFLQQRNWFQEDTSQLYLDFAEPYRPPRWTLSHNGTPFANLGELHVITGKSGHGKTSFMSMVMAAILKGSYGGLKYELHEEIPFPVVLYIDTEQGKDDTIALKNRICTLAGLDYRKPQTQFKIVRLRDTVDATKRWSQILKVIWEVRPTVVFLDGMLDIVKDYNNQEECQPIIRECMITATKYDISLWCVLHENPTFDKMVGTLGSVLQRKVTEGFAIRKHKQANEPKDKKRADRPPIYFTVEQLKARRYDQDNWDFEVINNAEGWGVPQELDAQPEKPATEHTPEEIQEWITKGQNSIEWPAHRRDIYTNIFAPNGVTDEDEQKEVMKVCINRRFFIEQTKEEMTPSQKNPRLKLNEEIILPF